MANNRMTEGVGKKIVEALKMQNDVEITPDVSNTVEIEDTTPVFEESDAEQPVVDFSENDIVESNFDSFEVEDASNDDFSTISDNFDATPAFNPQPTVQNFEPQFETNFETPIMPQTNISSANIEDFEVPSNVAVLKQLISKLPAGVTKQTGAMIIKQTMEALGISMKSVLQEAQQVQEGLNNSTRECQASISEYKRQIGILEKQAQKYQRQYAALNDIISLFIQTNY